MLGVVGLQGAMTRAQTAATFRAEAAFLAQALDACGGRVAEAAARIGKVIGAPDGTVMPPGFQGSAPEIETLRANVAKAGLTGSLVANDGRSSVIVVPLVEADPDTGAHLDYGQFSERLETLVRARHETGGARIHIVGFAKLVGDLIHGARSIAAFFALTVLLTALLLQVYSRCWRSTYWSTSSRVAWPYCC